MCSPLGLRVAPRRHRSALLFFVVFFQPLILIGMALDVAVIVALVWLDWPTKSIVGA
jgi:hypothetical protein